MSSCANACVAEENEVVSLRREDFGAQELIVSTTQIPRNLSRPPLVEQDWVAICQALYQGTETVDWEDKHEILKETSKCSS